ncbi:MAG: 4-(cytidine 5'-diphospho)-2-C-methyl-D-erythritol kinase [Thermoguttaceae bacterium]|jgi:4-diphosphocytidyl-2-C-methyl-D-erythritol kinase
MQVRRSSAEIVVLAPAKLNLFFEVLARREDGYHEVETLMCPITLYDTLYFRAAAGQRLELQCRWASRSDGGGRTIFEELPCGAKNLVVRAVELIRRRVGANLGASLRLVKRIPTAAGLGGGSSDAAAALVAANKGWNLGLSRGRLAELAAELGSDVPFFLARGPSVCRGRGEQVEPVGGFGPLDFVIVRPPEGLATAAVYGLCRPAARPRSVSPLVEALRRGNRPQAGRLLHNRLQAAAGQLTPWIERLQNAFARQDCPGHGMSGSGTSYFGLCRHARQARRIAERLRANGLGNVYAVRNCH